MPIHSAAAWLTTGHDLAPFAYAGLALVGAVVLKRWAGGRRNQWERDWAGKMVLIVAPPNAVTLELLHHLAHLPHPPQILYLPPIPSPLPQPLLTLLHAIRLSASTAPPASESSGADQATAGDAQTRPVELHCEPLPPSPAAIRRFVRQWAAPHPGSGEGGRRIDAVVWADGWEISRALRWFRPARASGVRAEAVAEELAAKAAKRGAAGKVRFAEGASSKSEQGDEAEDQPWSSPAEARFHLLTAMLPFFLQAPMERSIRLINVVAPFYAAAIPSLGSNPDLQPESTPLLKAQRTDPALLTSGKTALRDVLLFKHLQRVLDALATAEQAKRIVPPAEGDDGAVDGEQAEPGPEGIRQRKAQDAAPASAPKTISVQSNIMALSVVLGLEREGIVARLLGWTSHGPTSWLSLIVYTLLFPLIWILTPSPNASIQSLLAALSAPVRYGDDAKVGNIVDAKGAATATVEQDRPSQAAVRGGDVLRNCDVIHVPIREESLNTFGQQVWEDLEKTVEQGVKACIAREAAAKERQSETSAGTEETFARTTQQTEGEDDSAGTDDWERLEVNEVMSDD